MVNQHLSIKDIDKLLRTTLHNNVDKDQLVLYTIIEKGKTNYFPDSKKGAIGNPQFIFDYCLKVFKNPKIDTVHAHVETLKMGFEAGMTLDEMRHLFEVALLCVESGIAKTILCNMPKKGGDDD